ncbi:Flp pilus assembly protein CpaB [Collimonas sp. NPDC087041]|uniref:Flp pilus assembly protein CpaB n=1 Tax=Collimonas sp. NPDC087041 TaxID=3363960 RepID=UPI00381B8769
MKISKNTLLLGGAVALGILCFVGAQYYLRNYLAQAEKKLAGQYETKQVIVAAVDIAPGSVLSTDNLAVRKIPVRYLSSNVLQPDDLETVSGQRVVTGLKPGDPIDRGVLERSDRPPLSTTVAKGERAITFPVDEISSISGLLVPGDIIDLIFTGKGLTENSYLPRTSSAGGGGAAASGTESGPKELTHVRPLLQAVPVLATGKMTKKRIVKTEDGKEREENQDFTTVTLKVSPDQAEKVLIAQKLGSLTAVLRNTEDTASFASTPLDEVTFKKVADAPVAGRGNFIEIITGGTGNGLQKTQADAFGQSLLSAITAKGGANASSSGGYDVKSRLGIASSSDKTDTKSNKIFPR